MAALEDEIYVSSDGKRKYLIHPVVEDNTCVIRLFEDDFCVMEMKPMDNVHGLPENEKKDKRYLQFANDYLESGMPNRTIEQIHSLLEPVSLDFSCDDLCDCLNSSEDLIHVKFFFKNGLEMTVALYISITIGVGEDYIIANDSEMCYERLPYKKIAGMSYEELLQVADSWDVDIIKEVKYLDIFGTEIYVLDYKGVPFYTHLGVINAMKHTSYLEKIEYLKTGSILKLDKKTKDEIAKMKLTNVHKKIFIWSFNEAGEPNLVMG